MTLGLGIESTAHTFSASVVDDKGKIYANVKSIYRPPSGSGIHPREASRHHAEAAPSVLMSALKESNTDYKSLDFIAYSAGPGLGPCLRVGATVARFISAYYGIPLVPVHHGVGHIELGSMLTDANDPLVLLLSGGHTMVLAAVNERWRVFGETLDLTLGQLIDQFGRAIGLASPAGPAVERLAEKGTSYIDMPYVVKGNDLSFSGLLTSVKRKILSESQENLAFSLQETAFAMLSEVTERALALIHKKELLIVGGVAANARLQQMMKLVSNRHGCEIKSVPIEYAGDCGAQIAWTGMRYFKSGYTVQPQRAFVSQSWRIDEVKLPWRS
jgi:N6-L-threonylcarbamoyladenine synthase